MWTLPQGVEHIKQNGGDESPSGAGGGWIAGQGLPRHFVEHRVLTCSFNLA
jgi:hypothetical protein